MKRTDMLYYEDIYDKQGQCWREEFTYNNYSLAGIRGLRALRAMVLNLKEWLNLPERETPAVRMKELEISSADKRVRLQMMKWSTNKVYRFIRNLCKIVRDEHYTSTQQILKGINRNSCSRGFWKVVYQKGIDRRQADLWWLITHNRLTIGRRLLHIGEASIKIIRNSKHLCPVCHEVQNREHLFVTCRITNEYWKRLLSFIERISSTEGLERDSLTLRNILRGLPNVRRKIKQLKKSIFSLCAIMFSAIWQTRNDNAFRDRDWCIGTIWKHFCRLLSNMLKALKKEVGQTEKKRRNILRLWGKENWLIKSNEEGEISVKEAIAQALALTE